MELVNVNDAAGDARTATHLLAFDSVHGRWQPAREHLPGKGPHRRALAPGGGGCVQIDLRRSRSCLQSLIPTKTGSAKAIGLLFPELQGKLNGHAVRVPLLYASLTDAVFELERSVTVKEGNGAFEAAANGPLHGILGYETRPLVSVDYVNDSRSCIVDGFSTMVVNGTQLKVYAWYDNEWGYSCRMADLVQNVALIDER